MPEDLIDLGGASARFGAFECGGQVLYERCLE
jgi:hypothetical protein